MNQWMTDQLVEDEQGGEWMDGWESMWLNRNWMNGWGWLGVWGRD